MAMIPFLTWGRTEDWRRVNKKEYVQSHAVTCKQGDTLGGKSYTKGDELV